nr:MAG TPA: hypothetical protein [Caudoviricetes sp.]
MLNYLFKSILKHYKTFEHDLLGDIFKKRDRKIYPF